jgi:hypothetical protein
MPGKGKLATWRYAPNEASPLLGQSTHDIYLNNTTCWRNVPEKVWDYTIGGYQVIKKWLSYREHDLLGRALVGLSGSVLLFGLGKRGVRLKARPGAMCQTLSVV